MEARYLWVTVWLYAMVAWLNPGEDIQQMTDDALFSDTTIKAWTIQAIVAIYRLKRTSWLDLLPPTMILICMQATILALAILDVGKWSFDSCDVQTNIQISWIVSSRRKAKNRWFDDLWQKSPSMMKRQSMTTETMPFEIYSIEMILAKNSRFFIMIFPSKSATQRSDDHSSVCIVEIFESRPHRSGYLIKLRYEIPIPTDVLWCLKFQWKANPKASPVLPSIASGFSLK